MSQPDIEIDYIQNEQSAELIIKDKSGDSYPDERVKGDISPALTDYSDKGEYFNKPVQPLSNRPDLVKETPIRISNEVVSKVLGASGMADSNLVVCQDKIPVEISGIIPALFPEDLEMIKVLTRKDLHSLKINDSFSATGISFPLSDRGRISGGLITLVKNTWLLNHETFTGLKSESLNITVLVFFPDAGLTLNYSLNKSWLLQADGFFYSNAGQEYLDYIYGHYSRKKITLRYSTVALSVKYKFGGQERFINGSSVNILAGGYLSVSHNVDQRINKDLENIGSEYKRFDFGVRLGGEFELRIFDRLSIAPGLFLSAGIPNIYEGTGNIPGYLRRTQNGSAGFHLAFYYHFD